MHIVKKADLPCIAFPLGRDHPLEADLTARGLIRRRADGDYEVFSREAAGGKGQLARPGDFVKLDAGGFPYPNERLHFLANHKHLEGDTYAQRLVPHPAWMAGQPLTEEMAFALDRGLVRLDPAHPERYFSSDQWGTHLTAPRDAAVVFYKVKHDVTGAVTGLELNFVVREQFEAAYDILD